MTVAPNSPEASKASAKDTFDQIYLAEMKKLQFGKCIVGCFIGTFFKLGSK